MTVTIRAMHSHERLAIASTHRASATAVYANIFPKDEPFPWEEVLRRWLAFQGEILVAEISGLNQLAVFVAFDERALHALYVLPEHWGHGSAGVLIADADDQLRVTATLRAGPALSVGIGCDLLGLVLSKTWNNE